MFPFRNQSFMLAVVWCLMSVIGAAITTFFLILLLTLPVVLHPGCINRATTPASHSTNPKSLAMIKVARFYTRTQ